MARRALGRTAWRGRRGHGKGCACFQQPGVDAAGHGRAGLFDVFGKCADSLGHGTRAGDRPLDGARSRRNRHRTGEMGRADGAVQPAWPRVRLRSNGRPGLRRAHRRAALSSNLVIVESPAKAKTIKKYLGKDFEVLASYGHVRDLIPKEGAVDPDKQFAMSYRSIERNEKHVDAISRALKKSKNLFLATDPDREGEAISWHLRELLEERGELKDKSVKRVVFYEITKGEVQRAVAEPRDLSLDLVN